MTSCRGFASQCLQACCWTLHTLSVQADVVESGAGLHRDTQQQPLLFAPTDFPSVTLMLPPGFVCAGKVAILLTYNERVSMSNPFWPAERVHISDRNRACS